MQRTSVISVFEGKPGAGKSYAAVVQMAKHLAKGLTIATNVELNWEGMRSYVRAISGGLEITDSQWVDLFHADVSEFHKLTPSGEVDAPVLIVIDETQLAFNARDWSGTSRDLLTYLSQARKLNNEVVFISQHQDNMDKQFRRLAGEIWRFRDLEKHTVPGLGISFGALYQVISFGMFNGKKLLACRYDYDGKTLLGREFIDKDKKVFNAYYTRSMVVDVSRSGVRGKVALTKATARGGTTLRVVMAIIGVGILGTIAWMKWGQERKKPETAVSPIPSIPRPSQGDHKKDVVSTQQGSTPKMQLVTEQFVGWQGGLGILRTQGGSYRVGVPCNLGIPLEVTRDGARIISADGGLVMLGVSEFSTVRVSSSSAPPPEKAKDEKPKTDPYAFNGSQTQKAQAGWPSADTRRMVAGLPPEQQEAQISEPQKPQVVGAIRGNRMFRIGEVGVQ